MSYQKKIALNRVRLRCLEADRGTLTVSSTIDQTHRMEHRTDEDINFSDFDLVAIKNRRGTVCSVLFEAIALPEGRRAVFRPSMQERSAYTILDPALSNIKSKIRIDMKPFETIMLSSSEFRARTGAGASLLA